MKINIKLFNIIIVYFVLALSFPQSLVFATENALTVKEDFEKGTYSGTNYLPVSGTITNDPQKVVNGKYSALLSAQTSEVWKEFSHSDSTKVKFEKNTTYNVTFSYNQSICSLWIQTASFIFLHALLMVKRIKVTLAGMMPVEAQAQER